MSWKAWIGAELSRAILARRSSANTIRTGNRIVEVTTKEQSQSMSVTKRTIVHLLIEVLIYVVLVSVYLAIVLHFLVGWLKGLSVKEPGVYAFVAILLMIAQA